MQSKISKIGLLLVLLMTMNSFSQWRYPNAKDIKNDVIITYEVKYDRELPEKMKQHPAYKKEIVVIFNKDKLLEKSFSNRVDVQYSMLLDYEKETSYQLTSYSTKKEGTKSEFKNPWKQTTLQEGKEITFLGFPCQVSTVKIKGKKRKIYTTKKIGLRFIKQFNTEGFLLKYTTNDKYFGPYTVTAKKIFYNKVPESTYSIAGYTIKTKEEQKKYLSERKEKTNAVRENAVEKIGELAPTYSVRSLKGNKFRSKKMTGKIVVFNFWFTTCGPCKKEIPDLNKLKEKFTGKDVEFIAVGLDAEYKIAKFLRKHPFKYDIVEDGRWIAEKFDVKLYPSNIIIDKEGKIQFYKIGYKKDITEAMSYKIENLLKEK